MQILTNADIGIEGQKIDDLSDDELNNLGTDDNNDGGEETAPESQPEKKEEEASPSQEGEEEAKKGEASEETPDEKKEDPLHKNPRFTQVIKERNELRDKIANYDDRFAKLEETQAQPKQEEPIPQWFKDQVGDDREQWNENQRRVEAEENRIADKVIQKQNVSIQKNDKEDSLANQFCDNAIQDLKDVGHKFDDKEFRQFMYENPIINIEKDELDFEKGLKLFLQTKNNSKPQEDKSARKKIASQTSPTNKGESKPDGYMTSSQLRNRSWSSLAGL